MPQQRDVLLGNEPSQIRSRKRRRGILAAASVRVAAGIEEHGVDWTMIGVQDAGRSRVRL